MAANTYTLTERQVIQRLQEFLVECDSDTLAGLFEHAFGGTCYTATGEVYQVTPELLEEPATAADEPVPAASFELPAKMSDLMELAVNDLEACLATGKYRANMYYWHHPDGDGDGLCEVCLAGAVMARELHTPEHVSTDCREATAALASVIGVQRSTVIRRKLLAIDCLRRGEFEEACDYLNKAFTDEALLKFQHWYDSDSSRLVHGSIPAWRDMITKLRGIGL